MYLVATYGISVAVAVQITKQVFGAPSGNPREVGEDYVSFVNTVLKEEDANTIAIRNLADNAYRDVKLRDITAGTWKGTAVGVGYGGTGLSTIPANAMLYASALDTLAALAIGSNNRILTVVSGAPSWKTHKIQTFVDLFGQEPRGTGTPEALVGNAGTSYGWSGSALTASTKTFYFDKTLQSADYVRWLLVWNPQSQTASGVRLVHMDTGPTNITQIAEFTNDASGTPVVSGVEITTNFNTLVSGGVLKFLGHQTKGNGTTGPLIFGSTLEIVWIV